MGPGRSLLLLLPLSSACGSTAGPEVPEVVVSRTVTSASSAPASVVEVDRGFVPDLPTNGIVFARDVEGSSCKEEAHSLGPLPATPDSLYPVGLAADEKGGAVLWHSPAGVRLQTFDATGTPRGTSITPAGAEALHSSDLMVGGNEILLVERVGTSTHLRLFDRTSLVAQTDTVVESPAWSVLAARFDGTQLFAAVTESPTELVLFHWKTGDKPRGDSIHLSEKLPADPLTTLGKLNGEDAVLITTIGGTTLLADGRGVLDAGADQVRVRHEPWVDVRPTPKQTGEIDYALVRIPRYPITRAEEAQSYEHEERAAFRIPCSYGIPVQGSIRSHLLVACATGGESERRATLFSIECR